MSAKDYYHLTKPGIIRGNAITATAGFLLASQGNFAVGRFFAMLGGISLVIASGCVFNNYIDRDIDKKMTRTKKRALVTGNISAQTALIFATALGLIGSTLLILFTNTLTFLIALFGFIAYVVVYGIAKRKSVHGTVVGSISGAVPPVVGYCAVTGQLDTAAILLFLILVFWQMPHFYAIAMYRQKEYAAAKIPVLPIVSGHRVAKIQMLIYIVAFTVAALALYATGYTGYLYSVVALALGVRWFWLGILGFKTDDDDKWAKSMFKFSLIVLTLLCVMISLNSYLVRA